MSIEERLAKLEEAVFATKPERQLYSLEEWDRQRWALHERVNDPLGRLNFIACPKCGAELYDNSSSIVMSSNPPMIGIHCESCDYKGSRIA